MLRLDAAKYLLETLAPRQRGRYRTEVLVLWVTDYCDIRYTETVPDILHQYPVNKSTVSVASTTREMPCVSIYALTYTHNNMITKIASIRICIEVPCCLERSRCYLHT